MKHANYTIIIEPASAEDGGGFLEFVPDLPGCMSDGNSYEQAARNVVSAIESWIEAATEMGRPIPTPTARRALAWTSFGTARWIMALFPSTLRQRCGHGSGDQETPH